RPLARRQGPRAGTGFGRGFHRWWADIRGDGRQGNSRSLLSARWPLEPKGLGPLRRPDHAAPGRVPGWPGSLRRLVCRRQRLHAGAAAGTCCERLRNAEMTQPSRTKRCLFVAILVLGTYLIVEGAVSGYAWLTWYDSSLNILEDAEGSIQFDAVRGYRL